MATSQTQTENSITVTVEVDAPEPVVNLPDGPTLDVPIDDALMAVRNDRRRRAIQAIEAKGQTTLSELTDALAAQEFDDPDSKQRKRVYVSIYQSHLPHLDDLGLVDFDGDSGDVVATDDLSGLVAWLDDSRARFEGDA